MNSLKNQLIMFIVMVVVGMLFNPMNILSYKYNHLYLSTTLFYGGIMMASNMIWSHEIVHYLSMGHFNISTFLTGICLSIFTANMLLRRQLYVNVKQWLRRMIPHHSTAITTTKQILRHPTVKDNPKLYRLMKDIIYNQEREILIMQSYL